MFNEPENLIIEKIYEKLKILNLVRSLEKDEFKKFIFLKK